jgi:hypothetical protein
MVIVCRKNLSQSDLMDCKIITIEGEENVFLVGSPACCQCLNSRCEEYLNSRCEEYLNSRCEEYEALNS